MHCVVPCLTYICCAEVFGICAQRKGKHDGFHSGILLVWVPPCPALTTSVFWHSLLSQSRSNCLQTLPHRSWRGELRRILTSLYRCVPTRHPDTRALSQYIPAKSGIVVWQEEPGESSSQMCPLTLMAAWADWRGKTPWRLIHLNSHLAPSRDKLIDIFRSLA